MNIYELIGIIIGDGHIGYNKKARRYWFEICGDVKDRKYFDQISDFLFSFSKKRPLIRVKKEKLGKSLRLEFNNKDFFNFLTKNLKLPLGNKTFSIKIPNKFTKWKYSKYILKGIFDTDGSIYFSYSKKSKYPTYPRLEIKTSSNNLAHQIVNILKIRGFKVNLMHSKTDKTNRICLNGSVMIHKWFRDISSSNLLKLRRYILWKKKGYFNLKKNL